MCISCGASHAGEGGLVPYNESRNPVYGSFINEHTYLSGAGTDNQTPGGGAIIIEADTVAIHGEIRAE